MHHVAGPMGQLSETSYVERRSKRPVPGTIIPFAAIFAQAVESPKVCVPRASPADVNVLAGSVV